MGFTDSLQRQHDEIIDIVTETASHLEPDKLQTKSDHVANLLKKLAGKLGAHLAMEDNVLYPKLLEHDDPNVKKITQEFIGEMGDLSVVFKNYVGRWQKAQDIKEKSTDFIKETNEVFAALGTRVEKENTILYPILDG